MNQGELFLVTYSSYGASPDFTPWESWTLDSTLSHVDPFSGRCSQCAFPTPNTFCDPCQARLDFEAKVKNQALEFWDLYKEKGCPTCHFEILVLYSKDDWIVDHSKPLRLKPARFRTHKTKILWHLIPCVDCAYANYKDKWFHTYRKLIQRLKDEKLALRAGGHYASEEEFKVRYFEKQVKLANSLARKMGTLLVQGVQNPEHREAILDSYRLKRMHAMMDAAKYLKESYCEWLEMGIKCDLPVEKYSKLAYCPVHKPLIEKILSERKVIKDKVTRRGRTGLARNRQIGGWED